MAYNQGFYNLFLAIGTAIGLVLFWTGGPAPAARPGRARAVQPRLDGRGRARAPHHGHGVPARRRLIQGTLPLIGFVLFLFA